MKYAVKVGAFGGHTVATLEAASAAHAIRSLAFRLGLWNGASKPRPTINPGFSEALLGFPTGWTDSSR